MQGRSDSLAVGAAGAVASAYGVLAGLGGITHGIGETLQGNVAPSGVVINSWTQGPIATNLGGEPGMTIVPNLFVTGVLTLIVSSALLIWAAALVQRKNGGLVVILLSITMLLVGGGFAPPIVGILAGIAGLGINAPLTWWRRHLSASARHLSAKLWPWVFGVSVVNGVFLVVGSVTLVYFAGLNDPGLFTNSFLFAVLSSPLTIVTALAHDIQ